MTIWIGGRLPTIPIIIVFFPEGAPSSDHHLHLLQGFVLFPTMPHMPLSEVLARTRRVLKTTFMIGGTYYLYVDSAKVNTNVILGS